jgi:hypothetical protein
VSGRDGVSVFLESCGVTRGPLLKVKNIAQARKIIVWIEKNWKKLGDLTTPN